MGPKLASVLGAWPRLATLRPAWFAALAAELASFTCNFALQRLALQASGCFTMVTAGLVGRARRRAGADLAYPAAAPAGRRLAAWASWRRA